MSEQGVSESPAIRRTEQLRKAQRLVNDYHRTFSTDYGQRVLADLASTFGLNGRVFIPIGKGNHNAYDPLAAALCDGARAVVIRINEKLSSPALGDDNTKPPKGVIKS
jgi:hypothetical protein